MSFRSANQGYSEVSGMVVRELAKVQTHPQKPRLILGEERTPSPLMRGHPISTFFYRRIQYLIYPRPEQGKSLIRADGQKSVDCRGGNAEVRDTKAGMNPACRIHRSGDAPRGPARGDPAASVGPSSVLGALLFGGFGLELERLQGKTALRGGAQPEHLRAFDHIDIHGLGEIPAP